jgi:hypothetical protein
MANTYTQLHIHGIFAVQNRISLIKESWREELYKYITGIVQNHGHKMLQIGGMNARPYTRAVRYASGGIAVCFDASRQGRIVRMDK